MLGFHKHFISRCKAVPILFGATQKYFSTHIQAQSALSFRSNLDKHHQTFQPILDKYDKARRLIEDVQGISLMSVVVIGDQSHGKSSLLEAISGVDLPRGHGTKTRVPLEIQLRNVSDSYQEKIVISSYNKAETIDKTEIAGKIEEFTRLLAGNNSNRIVNKPLTVSIYRQNMVDLTIVDLPGIIHNHEDKSMPKIVEDMIHSYISNQDTIILNVMQCTNDAKTCKSLEMSKKVDEIRDRTLLVLTKIDRIESVSHLNQIFEEYQEKYGFEKDRIFLARNRSAQDSASNMSNMSHFATEQAFFEQHKDSLTQIPVQSRGVNALTQTLVSLQKQRILKILPHQTEKIKKQLDQSQLERQNLGKTIDGVVDSASELSFIFLQLYQDLQNSKDGLSTQGTSTNIVRTCTIQTDSDAHDYTIDHDEQPLLCAKIQTLFDNFNKDIDMLHRSQDFISNDFINRIKNVSLKRRAFKALPDELHHGIATQTLRDIVESARPKTLELCDRVADCVMGHVTQDIKSKTSLFPVLQRVLIKQFTHLINELKQPLNDRINEVIDLEKTRPFTLNHYYMSTVHQVEQSQQQFTTGTTTNSTNATPIKTSSRSKKIRISGRLGHNSPVNGTYTLDSVSTLVAYQHDTEPRYRIVKEGSGLWTITNLDSCAAVAIQHDAALCVSPVQVKTWSFKNQSKKNAIGSTFTPDFNVRVESVNEHHTSENDFLDNVQARSTLIQQIIQGSNEDQIIFKECIKIAAYWKVVRKRLIDYVCMYAWKHLVENPSYTHDMMKQRLMNNKNYSNQTDEQWLLQLMSFDEELKQRQKQCEIDVKNLKEAYEIMEDIRILIQ